MVNKIILNVKKWHGQEKLPQQLRKRIDIIMWSRFMQSQYTQDEILMPIRRYKFLQDELEDL